MIGTSALTRRLGIFNALDRAAVREQWQARFHNRSVTTPRANAQVKIRNAGADEVEILLYDEIGFWGVLAKDFVAALAGITAPSILVRINSPGGDVFDGLAIYNALKAHPATINTSIEGLAASAASFIALAGKTVSIAPSAFMMIHKAWGFTIGNADDHRDQVTILDKIDSQLANIYAAKTGKTADEILALMKGEADGTWFTGAEAKAIGLVDVVAPLKEGGEVVDPQEESEQDDDEGPDESTAEARVAHMRRRLALARHAD